MEGLSGFITSLTSVITMLFNQFTNILQMYTTEPALIVVFGIFVAGAVIGLSSRVFGR